MYPDSYPETYNKVDNSGYDSLTDAEKVVFCVGQLEAEINNGGFSQFFLNSSGDFTAETLTALEKIGARKTKQIVQEAASLMGDTVPSNRNARQGLFEAKSEEIEEQLDDLDARFYLYEDDIASLVNDYLRDR